eukprot:CAMPEP_0172767564 /NCGR_PEP_ID=MMETSP1074-20121228/183150_1 /TAXON_ID=2916 /ORGANISM="Ceratium fusus, Strain PA161109" /LENGTH=39 /DNA_ID= /DNA_START= /DNA_END= /DNA_ORIENTATION=
MPGGRRLCCGGLLSACRAQFIRASTDGANVGGSQSPWTL